MSTHTITEAWRAADARALPVERPLTDAADEANARFVAATVAPATILGWAAKATAAHRDHDAAIYRRALHLAGRRDATMVGA